MSKALYKFWDEYVAPKYGENFNFLSNNVKGLQLSKQWLKLFQFFKNKISSKGIVFTRNTFFENHENIWSNKFNGDL